MQASGASLRLDSESTVPGGPQSRVFLPLRRLESIVVMGNVWGGSQLLARCADDGRPIVWMSVEDRFRSRNEGLIRGNVLL